MQHLARKGKGWKCFCLDHQSVEAVWLSVMALKGLMLWCMVSFVSLLSLVWLLIVLARVLHFRMFFSPSGKVSSERFTFSCFKSAFLHAEVCIALSRGELKVHEPLPLLSAAVSLLLRHFVKQTSVHCFPLSRHCSRSHLKF